MLYYDKRFDDGWRIAIWHVTEELEELYYMLPDDISVREEAERRFKSISRIIEWTAVRVLLFDMLDRQVEILYDHDGAPHLPEYEHLDISISHTKGYVAVALAVKVLQLASVAKVFFNSSKKLIFLPLYKIPETAEAPA